MIFHWLFIIGTLILCAIAAMPTRAWLAIGERLKGGMVRQRQRRLEEALAAQKEDFSPEESFLPQGGGLAVDHRRGLVFLAEPDGAGLRAAILPAAALGAHAARTEMENGFQEHFLEINVPGTARPLWRLPCADANLAAEMDAALTRL